MSSQRETKCCEFKDDCKFDKLARVTSSLNIDGVIKTRIGRLLSSKVVKKKDCKTRRVRKKNH